MLYKGFGRLEQAEQQCRAALETGGKRLGDEDRELVPYHLALAGILILSHKLEKADKEIGRAEQLAGSLPRDRQTPPGATNPANKVRCATWRPCST